MQASLPVLCSAAWALPRARRVSVWRAAARRALDGSRCVAAGRGVNGFTDAAAVVVWRSRIEEALPRAWPVSERDARSHGRRQRRLPTGQSAVIAGATAGLGGGGTGVAREIGRGVGLAGAGVLAQERNRGGDGMSFRCDWSNRAVRSLISRASACFGRRGAPLPTPPALRDIAESEMFARRGHQGFGGLFPRSSSRYSLSS